MSAEASATGSLAHDPRVGSCTIELGTSTHPSGRDGRVGRPRSFQICDIVGSREISLGEDWGGRQQGRESERDDREHGGRGRGSVVDAGSLSAVHNDSEEYTNAELCTRGGRSGWLYKDGEDRATMRTG